MVSTTPNTIITTQNEQKLANVDSFLKISLNKEEFFFPALLNRISQTAKMLQQSLK
ncbi:unnamed protein product, partial [Didymodactylos carnosus]